MPTKIYVNLPVKDLARSAEFFTKLGFSFDERFSNDEAGCLIISDHIYAMLITEPFFRTFTTKDLADASKTTETIVALELDSRQQVDQMAARALESGGSPASQPMEQDGVYERSFADPDGHLWEVFHMDPAAVPAG
ncbi:MAG: VOC family protein [Streptosporangiaceae bacterium]